MTTEPQDAAIVSATLYIAKRMELLAVAEGVETEDQAKSLKAQGCDLFQGYLFSRPVPASDAEKLLLDYHQQTELKIC